MVSLSISEMTGWVNPFRVAVRRPGTLSIARRWSVGAFFLWHTRALVDTTAIDTHGSKAVRTSHEGGVLAVAVPPSHREPRTARHDGAVSVALPANGLAAPGAVEQIVGRAGGPARETADASAAV
jgi:hypothetical protein